MGGPGPTIPVTVEMTDTLHVRLRAVDLLLAEGVVGRGHLPGPRAPDTDPPDDWMIGSADGAVCTTGFPVSSGVVTGPGSGPAGRHAPGPS